jgi:hypothetical protein
MSFGFGVSDFLSAVPLAAIVLESIQSLFASESWTPALSQNQIFLRVYESNVQLIGDTYTPSELEQALGEIPTQLNGRIRLYVFEGCLSQQSFQNHIQLVLDGNNQHYGRKPPSPLESVRGFAGLSSQWRDESPAWWPLDMYEFPIPQDEIAATGKYYNRLEGAIALAWSLIRCQRSICIMKTHDEGLLGK